MQPLSTAAGEISTTSLTSGGAQMIMTNAVILGALDARRDFETTCRYERRSSRAADSEAPRRWERLWLWVQLAAAVEAPSLLTAGGAAVDAAATGGERPQLQLCGGRQA